MATYERGSVTFGCSRCTVACRAALPNVEHGTFFGCPVSWGELFSSRADCDIPGADFFRFRGPPKAVGGRLGPGSLANPEDRRNEEKSKKAHCERSRRWRPSTVERYCQPLGSGLCPGVRSSISRRRLALVEPCPVRPCSAT